MSLVNLTSGGLDSTLISVMAAEQGQTLFPLFLDYGQRAAEKEWETCKVVHESLNLPPPQKMDISGFGKVITTGLTSEKFHIKDDAFTPGRNLLFLLMGASYAYQTGAEAVSIGILAEESGLFPDQTQDFIVSAEATIQKALGTKIQVISPLSTFKKADIIELAKRRGINNTYSCHSGQEKPCGKCISCLEFIS